MRLVALVVALLLVGLSAGLAYAVFSDPAPVTGNAFSTKADWQEPVVSESVIAKTVGYAPGFIKQNGAYYVYANVADGGNPPSGISTVTANIATITTGQTAVTMTAGSYSVGGVSYNYRTASVTSNTTLTAGVYSYSIATTDAGGNAGTTNGLTVEVDNTAVSASDIQTANGGAIIGRADQGDTITYTFSEPVDPNSILAGWTGASTSVVVRLNDIFLGNDTVTIFNAANSSQLPLGSINLGRGDYTSSNRTFGATGTASTMVMSGSTITFTLGTQSGSATTAGGNGTMSWSPSSTATDRAGNACTTTSRSETGTSDKEF